MREIRRTVKMGLLIWMFANPVLFFLIVAPTSRISGWLPEWVKALHNLLLPLFYRHYVY